MTELLSGEVSTWWNQCAQHVIQVEEVWEIGF